MSRPPGVVILGSQEAFSRTESEVVGLVDGTGRDEYTEPLSSRLEPPGEGE